GISIGLPCHDNTWSCQRSTSKAAKDGIRTFCRIISRTDHSANSPIDGIGLSRKPLISFSNKKLRRLALNNARPALTYVRAGCSPSPANSRGLFASRYLLKESNPSSLFVINRRHRLTISRVRRIKRRRVNLFPSRNNFLKNFLLKNRRNGSPTNNACPKDLGNARLQLVIALEMLRSNNFLKTMALAPQSLNLSISAKLARNLPLGIIVVTEVLDFLDIQLEVHSLPWVKWVDRSVIIFRLHLCLELVEDFHTITETPDS